MRLHMKPMYRIVMLSLQIWPVNELHVAGSTWKSYYRSANVQRFSAMFT